MYILRKLKRFYKTHIWFQVCCIFGTAILLITLAYQSYMKSTYSSFLLEKNYLMESAVMETMQMNLDQALYEYIDMGAQIATDANVYKLSEQLLAGELDNASGLLQVRTKFSIMANYSKNIMCIMLFTKSGDIYQYDRLNKLTVNLWTTDEHADYLCQMYKDVYELANQRNVPRYIVNTQPATHPATGEQVFHIFYPVVGKENNFAKTNSMVCVTYSMDILQPLVDVMANEGITYSEGYITDADGVIIYHYNEVYNGQPEQVYLDSADLFILDTSLQNLNWTLHISLNKTELDRNVTQITGQGMIVYIILLIGLMLVFYLIIRKINRILNKIQRAMLVTGSGGERKKVKICGEHEIWQLAGGYNDMLDKLALQEAEVKMNHQLSMLALERQHKAEREALETQINAHFICNTLGTINYEAMESGNHKVSQQIKALSNILRYTFDQKCQNVFMSQEISWIIQYLYLQKMRLEDVFDYSIDFPHDCDSWPCCKLMLQPFVENAIMHGFEGRENGGLLTIKAQRQEQYLRLSIKDNGCGISEVKLAKIQEVLAGERRKNMDDIGIGIQNVASRMRLFYGSKLEIKLYSTEGRGTEFEFLLPLPEKNIDTLQRAGMGMD